MVYTCKSFTGHWPVGTAAVVNSDSAYSACLNLNEALVKQGLPGDATPEMMIPMPEAYGAVVILNNGDY